MRSLHLFALIWAGSLAFTHGASTDGVKLDPLLARPDLWALKPDTFPAAPEAQPYEWTSKEHDSARAARDGQSLFGMPVFESIARFESGKLTGVTSVFYGRGDAGELTREQFEKALTLVIAAVTNTTKVKYTARGKDAASAVHAEGLEWKTPVARYLLEYSFTHEVKTRNIPFRAEFIRLTVTPPERSVGLLTSATSTTRAKFTGATHVKRDLVSGDVFITDVPMVDQGEKGYCAVACTERVMRYFGLQVDANELAQVANSDADKGTNADTMFEALKKLGARLRMRVRPVEELEPKQMLTLIKDYNSAAKRGSRAPLVPDPGHMINLGAVFKAMDPAILEEVRTKSKADVARFQRDVATHADAGFPLIWSVMLGMVPEKGIPQTAGGHMRLIIGYNTKTGDILYTDSWGAGHELKRMPIGSAVTITTGLTALEPM